MVAGNQHEDLGQRTEAARMVAERLQHPEAMQAKIDAARAVTTS